MKTVTFAVSSLDDAMRRAKDAFSGVPQGALRTFASYDQMWKTLAPNRMAIVYALTGSGPLGIREVARRVGRDVRAVHADIQMLLGSGVLDKTDDGLIEFPFDQVHVDFMLRAA